LTSIEFRAPWSASLRTMTVTSMGVMALVVMGAIVARPPLLAAVLLIALPLIIVASTVAGRVRGYTLTEDAITVHRGLWDTRLPLTGLRSVTGDVDAMRGSIRMLGNGGVFAFTGRFWNSKLGWYRAYATDPGRAVVLRYANRTIVISPHDPQHFIMRARTLLKVADFPK
jgi:PH (Pleckstrin Homology) domain-containing protein